MVAFELNQVFIASVSIMQLLGMMRSDEFVMLARCKERWDEALFDVGYRCQLIQVKASFFLNRFAHKSHGSADEELGNFGVRCSQFVAKRSQVREWGVEHHATD